MEVGTEQTTELEQKVVIHNDVFNNIVELTGGKIPTLEAYCNTHSANRCLLSMQKDEFLEAMVDKQDVWIHPPLGQEKHAIEHYLL